jgi:hypothetical protein
MVPFLHMHAKFFTHLIELNHDRVYLTDALIQ